MFELYSSPSRKINIFIYSYLLFKSVFLYQNKHVTERKASPYAVTPCPNIGPSPTPPATPPCGYNVPRPTTTSARSPSPIFNSPPSPGVHSQHPIFGNYTSRNEEGINGPSSLNILIGPGVGASGVASHQEPSPTSSLSSSGVSTFSSTGSTSGTNMDVLAEKNNLTFHKNTGGSSYASKLSLRGTSGTPNGGAGTSPRKLGTTSTPVQKRSLEDNYGAVVAANHQALAQLLEQVKLIM